MKRCKCWGDNHGSDDVQKMVCVLNVAWVLDREGPKEMFNVCVNIVGCAVVIGGYVSARRNFTGNGPGVGFFMNFWQKVEVSRAWVFGSKKMISLFGSENFLW